MDINTFTLCFYYQDISIIKLTYFTKKTDKTNLFFHSHKVKGAKEHITQN